MAAGSPNRIRAPPLPRCPARAAAHLRKVNTPLTNRNLAAALRSYDEALDEDQGNPYAGNHRGIVQEALGSGLEALRCHNRAIAARLEKAFALSPRFATARVLLEQTQAVP